VHGGQDSLTLLPQVASSCIHLAEQWLQQATSWLRRTALLLTLLLLTLLLVLRVEPWPQRPLAHAEQTSRPRSRACGGVGNVADHCWLLAAAAARGGVAATGRRVHAERHNILWRHCCRLKHIPQQALLLPAE
jgi:hypothetical protein